MLFKIKNVNANLLVFCLFVILFILQDFFFKALQNSSLPLAASLIYLPHGLRVLATLIAGSKILVGLFMGHFITGIYIHYSNGLSTFFSDPTTILLIFITSTISTCCVFVSIKLLKNLDNRLNEITLKTILLVSILSALINSLFVNLTYFLFIKDWNINNQIFQYFLGDIIGSIIIFYIIKNIYKNIKFLENY
tara:strand:+ start:262 stop:840 length:579 start_codon:yes stop_codon:yes gene_type:complete